jgi:hypothetical protein
MKLDDEEIETLITTKLDELLQFHNSVGRRIRNEYFLWHDDNPYTDNIDPDSDTHPDQMSQRIIESIWSMVQQLTDEDAST